MAPVALTATGALGSNNLNVTLLSLVLKELKTKNDELSKWICGVISEMLRNPNVRCLDPITKVFLEYVVAKKESSKKGDQTRSPLEGDGDITRNEGESDHNDSDSTYAPDRGGT